MSLTLKSRPSLGRASSKLTDQSLICNLFFTGSEEWLWGHEVIDLRGLRKNSLIPEMYTASSNEANCSSIHFLYHPLLDMLTSSGNMEGKEGTQPQGEAENQEGLVENTTD